MNIIKFKDQIIPKDLVFNTFFKGKYVYAVNWDFAVPIGEPDGISPENYIILSQNPNIFEDSSDEARAFVSPFEEQSSDSSSDAPEDDECETYVVEFKDALNMQYELKNNDSHVFYAGEECVFSVYPDAGYRIYKVTVNGNAIEEQDVDGEKYYSFTVNEDSVVAIYAIRDSSVGLPIIDVNAYWDYIDITATTKANDVKMFVLANKFTTDDDITEDELRNFRTWLAQMMLELGSDLSEVEQLVLKYYASDMTDDVITAMSNLGAEFRSFFGLNVNSNNNCGCSSTRTLIDTSLITSLTPCDPVAAYRRMIHTQMVQMFSNVDFWLQYRMMLKDIKRYIQGILDINLPMYGTIQSTNFAECGKLSEKDIAQQTAIRHLSALIEALTYLETDEDTAAHRNFIFSTLHTFAESYYELMRWA